MNLNIFFGGTFIKKEELQEAGIEYPIKLEYYKIINEDEFIKNSNAKYGIKVVKTEYLDNDANIEEEKIKHLSNSEQRIDEILNILKQNEVTPIATKDVISDISKNDFYL